MLGRYRLAHIDAAACQRFVDELNRRGLAPKTVRGVYGTLSLVLGMARRDGLARPVEGVRSAACGAWRAPDPDSRAGRDARRGDRPAYVGDGPPRRLLRSPAGECLALLPENVDWLGRRLRVEATLNLRNQRRESPKGGHGRWVTMPTIVADSLAAHLQAHPASEYLFHRADGRAWKASRVWEAWTDARKACKLVDVRFHHLRHHAASLMIAAGWSVPRVAAELGHRDPAMTLRIYAHPLAERVGAGSEPARRGDRATLRTTGGP